MHFRIKVVHIIYSGEMCKKKILLYTEIVRFCTQSFIISKYYTLSKVFPTITKVVKTEVVTKNFSSIFVHIFAKLVEFYFSDQVFFLFKNASFWSILISNHFLIINYSMINKSLKISICRKSLKLKPSKLSQNQAWILQTWC